MPWVKLDDHFGDHPKILQAGGVAVLMYVAGLSYAGRHLTDGFIPRQALPGLVIDRELAELAGYDDPVAIAQCLVEVGLWERVDKGYLIHDFTDYNPSRAQWEAKREATRERQRRYLARANAAKEGMDDDANGVNNGVTNGVTNAAPEPVPVPVPEPDPEPHEKRRESDDTDGGAGLPPVGPPRASPSTFDGWITRIRAGPNRYAEIREMIAALYPDQDLPDTGRLGGIAGIVGGWGRLAELVWRHSTRPPTGDLLSYLVGVVRGSKDEEKPDKDRDGWDYVEGEYGDLIQH